MTTAPPPPLNIPNEPTFSILVQHWAKARIDVPLQLIEKFDAAGKQLVTIGTTLQTIYLGLFLSNVWENRIDRALIMWMSIPLWLTIVLAALAVCIVHVDTKALPTFQLFENPNVSGEKLWNALQAWCNHLHRSATWKIWLLRAAKTLLIASLAVSVFGALSKS